MRKCRVLSSPADLADADLYEYRFDRYPFKKEHIRYPCIFTLRSRAQGGAFCGSERQREVVWRRLLKYRPTYIDLEYNTPFTLPGRKLISYHNFDETPKVLPKVDKVACYARSLNDALRLMTFAQKEGILGIAMGEHGLITRLFAQPWTYISPHPEYGQLSEEELARYDPSLPLYGLIGGRVDQSPSHITHNQCGVCYVKMAVQRDELAEFFTYAHLFKGLSVTIPLKEAVMPFVQPDREAAAIGAVNTIVVADRLYGYNTDGKGALDALGDVNGKKMVILGAGGSARAIAYEGKQRGAAVSLVNRTHARAADLADRFGLRAVKEIGAYDILVNTTPLTPPIIAGSTVLDLNLIPPPYLKEAHRKGCRIVHAFEMFINQAIGQFFLWKNVKNDTF